MVKDAWEVLLRDNPTPPRIIWDEEEDPQFQLIMHPTVKRRRLPESVGDIVAPSSNAGLWRHQMSLLICTSQHKEES